MRARQRLATLVASAAILFAGTPAYLIATSATQPGIPVASCPAGTNWNGTQCI